MNAEQNTSALRSAAAVLNTWHDNIKRVAVASHNSANFSSRCNLLLGIPTILVTGAVGASAITDALTNHKGVLAMLSVLATTLTGLQAFLGLTDRSAKHENVATEYGCLKRRIQQFMARPAQTDQQIDTFLTEIREAFDNIARTTPQIPTRIWNAALKAHPPGKTAPSAIQNEQITANPTERNG